MKNMNANELAIIREALINLDSDTAKDWIDATTHHNDITDILAKHEAIIAILGKLA